MTVKAKKRVRYVWRDAGTGKIISARAAKQRDKDTVVHERVGKK